ncbi:uncharacterized protein GGS22DRAFT_50726 [Annulohypoxylon maeteangense]|uniref:uncharacterized protein n=1 Tax=Annulohypoxylon maeteangense TaxID=1927788 RepID=UPI002007C570|nr:uncharacterized protein GGS22DRAFT_50726 [Annulohypoxylon maeteangense]KAI0882356.1 hypothetical protein GGS22DRAFT_50726 [Annulohypoxylon maeteangense]
MKLGILFAYICLAPLLGVLGKKIASPSKAGLRWDGPRFVMRPMLLVEAFLSFFIFSPFLKNLETFPDVYDQTYYHHIASGNEHLYLS